MTKLRPALSTEQALDRIFGVLDRKVVSKQIKRSVRTLRDYGDPDHKSCISFNDALFLDREYNRAGGDGFPLAQSFLFRLEAEAAVPGFCPDALQRATQSAAIEVGEAVAALVGATRLGATPADRALAKREAEQAMTALSHTLPMLDETVSPGGTVFTGGSTRP